MDRIYEPLHVVYAPALDAEALLVWLLLDRLQMVFPASHYLAVMLSNLPLIVPESDPMVASYIQIETRKYIE